MLQHAECRTEEKTDPDFPGDRLRRKVGDRFRKSLQIQQVHGGDSERQHGQQGRQRFYRFMRNLQ